MQSAYPRYWPIFIAVVTLFLIYRRFRRSFGRQLLSVTRMRLRIGVLVLVGCSLLPAAFTSLRMAGAGLIGLAAGVGLAIWGANRTRYQSYAGQLHYVPHTYTGIAVSLLFIGRLIFRFSPWGGIDHPGTSYDASQGFASSTMMKSPLTFGLLYVLVGYYVSYYALVLRKSKHLGPDDIEETSPAAAPT